MTDSTIVSEFDLPGLELQHRGKVRDVYRLGSDRLLMIASDRLSAFDVVLPDPIPGKGEILTRLSNHWFRLTEDLCPNHLLATSIDDELPADIDPAPLRGRSVIVRALQPVAAEAIARGYLAGSAWKDYQRTGQVGGHRLKPGLREAELLDEPIFTPSTKAAVGEHDQTMTFDDLVRQVGGDLAEQLRSITLDLYAFARRHADARGIIIADTKFEFGLDREGSLRVMDEMLTPDSSRFWPADQYLPGRSPASFDKQFVRDYLLQIGWDQRPPGPHLPTAVIEGTRARYAEALQRLTAPG
jgi:phosphoribosylaminoimidazole-succinocarboxamide synthase